MKEKFRKEGDQWVKIEENKFVAVLKEIAGELNEFQVLPDGKIDIEGELPAYLDEPSAKIVIQEFERRGNDMVIDYEHQTLKGGEAPAAGWIKKLIYKGAEGLWALVEWTERAKQYIQNKEYRYFSPVIWITAKERKIAGVANVALTNFPRINNLQPILNKMNQESLITTQKEGTHMLEKLKKLLGLAADAVEEKVTEAVELLVNKVKTLETVVACKEVLEAIGAKMDAGKEEVLQIVASMKVPADVTKQLSLEVASLKKELGEIKQRDLIELALKEGKTSPEELDKWGRDLALKNPDQFKVIVLSRPQGSVIPMGRIPEGSGNRGPEMDEAQRKINEMLGVSEETFKKHNKSA